MPSEPLVALQAALLSHLTANVTVTGLRTRRGWPEHHDDLALDSGPLLATVVGEDTQTPINPRSVGTEGAATIYKVSELFVPVQLHAFAAYRAILDDLIEAIDAALSNRLPNSPDLWLDSTDYHDRPLIFTRRRLRRVDEADAAATGQWEAIWSLDCRSDRVLLTSHPEISLITTRLTDLSTLVSEDTTAASSS